MSTQPLLINLLNLNRTSPYIVASAIISKDGLVITSGLPDHIDHDRTSAVTAGLFSTAKRASETMSGGKLERIVLKCSDNYVLITSMGDAGMLVVIAKPQAILDLIFIKMQHEVEKLQPLYNAFYGNGEDLALAS